MSVGMNYEIYTEIQLLKISNKQLQNLRVKNSGFFLKGHTSTRKE